MSGPRIHVVGAGMAGLGAAVHAAKAGARVIVHEAAGRPGGRCRSFIASELERTVDNGTHLILGANTAVFDYLEATGARDALVPAAGFPFLDLVTGERWTVRPGRLSTLRAIGATPADVAALLRLWRADEEAVVASLTRRHSRLYQRLWRPLTVSALNTEPEQASARLLWRVVTLALLRGAAAARPYLVRETLDATFVAPALATLEAAGATVRLNRQLVDLEHEGRRVTGLRFAEGLLPIGLGERVILALPPWVTASLVPRLPVPTQFRAIVNAHFRLKQPPDGGVSLLGLVGGEAQWLFVRGDVVSVTVSAADSLAADSLAEIARRLWRDAARALALPPVPLPPWRIVKERRATIAHTPEQLKRRPGPVTRFTNLWLAGDWTDTGLPCTIDGALRSGVAAAQTALVG
ncbi:MAG: hydroxysqualene dehydroxylase HpnE [Alphaproteobacteria bacterium]